MLADIPGLIEGAAEGAGLGHEFLAHVERCSILVHLVELGAPEGNPRQSYETVRAELSSYGAGLDSLPELVVLSKRDLLPDGEVDSLLELWSQWLDQAALGVVAVSSASGAGLDQLKQRIIAELPALAPRPGQGQSKQAGGFEAEHRTYRPLGEGGYQIRREEDRAFASSVAGLSCSLSGTI